MNSKAFFGLLFPLVLFSGYSCPFSREKISFIIPGTIQSTTETETPISATSSTVAIDTAVPVPGQAVQYYGQYGNTRAPAGQGNTFYSQELGLSLQLPAPKSSDALDGFTGCSLNGKSSQWCTSYPEPGHYVLVGNVRNQWSPVIEIFINQPTSTAMMVNKIIRTSLGKLIIFSVEPNYFATVLAPYTPAINWQQVPHYAAVIEPSLNWGPQSPLTIFASANNTLTLHDFEQLVRSVRLQ